MKITLWNKANTTIYVGGDPNRGEPPLITIEAQEPQIIMDAGTNVMVIKETK